MTEGIREVLPSLITSVPYDLPDGSLAVLPSLVEAAVVADLRADIADGYEFTAGIYVYEGRVERSEEGAEDFEEGQDSAESDNLDERWLDMTVRLPAQHSLRLVKFLGCGPVGLQLVAEVLTSRMLMPAEVWTEATAESSVGGVWKLTVEPQDFELPVVYTQVVLVLKLLWAILLLLRPWQLQEKPREVLVQWGTISIGTMFKCGAFHFHVGQQFCDLLGFSLEEAEQQLNIL